MTIFRLSSLGAKRRTPPRILIRNVMPRPNTNKLSRKLAILILTELYPRERSYQGEFVLRQDHKRRVCVKRVSVGSLYKDFTFTNVASSHAAEDTLHKMTGRSLPIMECRPPAKLLTVIPKAHLSSPSSCRLKPP